MRTKLGIGSLVAVILTISLFAYYSLFFDRSETSGGLPVDSTVVARIASFTLTGCGSCNKALNELERVKAEFPNYEYERFDIIEDPDTVNRYGVDSHPTVLFLNADGQELGRVTQQVDAETVMAKLADLAAAPPAVQAAEQHGSPHGSLLTTVYLMEGERLVPVSQYLPQQTLVKFPKVAAMQLLFGMHDELPKAVRNAIPAEVDFEEIRADAELTVVQVSQQFEALRDTAAGRRIEQAIALTLAEYGVERLQVVTAAGKGEVLDAQALLKQHAHEGAHSPYRIGENAYGWTPSADTADLYNAALLHRHALQYIPCFCGCEEAGHLSNWNCYFEENAELAITPTPHAENCRMCLDITRTYLVETSKGTNLHEIRRMVEQQYDGMQGTPTPNVPS